MNLQEQTYRIKQMMGILKEETERQFVKIYSDGGGSDDAAEYEGQIHSIPVEDVLANEPFKDTSYMDSSVNIEKMINHIKDGKKLPPIKVIQHPYDETKYIVVDGNHRLYAFMKSGKNLIKAIIIPHQDVLLMKNEWGEKPEESILLSDVIDNTKLIDKYFVKPDNTNSFREDDKGEVKEGLHDTSWENEDGDKVTLQDLLDATEKIPVKKVSVEKLKPKLLTWGNDKEEIEKIEKADLKYPILIFVDDDNKFISIIDGHHRAQKAVRNNLETIKAKIIPINSLPKKIKKVFGHLNRDEVKEGIVKENDDFQTQWNILVDYENILNRKMPKKFPWWKEIDVQSIAPNGMGQTFVYGDLFVDEDWARKQWETLHPSQIYFPGANNIDFKDLLTVNEWNEIKEISSLYYTILTGQNADRMTMNRLNIYFDVPKLPKMEQNETEITEKCWSGYTQKGMKTMFGKRYPNCVKKSKK